MTVIREQQIISIAGLEVSQELFRQSTLAPDREIFYRKNTLC